MKIVVLNGSPKGDSSVTMQYVAFMQKKLPQHDFKIVNIAQRIKKIESDEQIFGEITGEIKSADGIIWAFPLYVFLVHSGYKRFIELITERAAGDIFQGKHAAILTTSIHFYDHTAHNYMHGICDDLNMKFYASYSAGMHDLFKEKERAKLLDFSQGFFESITRDAPAIKVYPALINQSQEYVPGTDLVPVKTHGRKVVVLTDSKEDNINLNRLIGRFGDLLSGQVEVYNLHSLDIKGSCLGCIRCGYDNTCVYSGKDEFIDFYNSKLKSADILVFAGTIHDRYLSSLWKTFFDRGFFNTHTPSFSGLQIAFLISGPLGQLPNLRQIMEAYTEWQQANLVGIVTDEHPNSAEIDGMLQELAQRSIDYSNLRYVKPATFLGVGGTKVFRDDIWGPLRFPFRADHRFYKSNGIYDFPQKDYSSRMQNYFLGLLVKIPFIRKEIYGKLMITKMVEPFKKLVAKI
ncbi:NAD(P)H-dependent oxidoreductase [Desulfosporosinus fructosivorans]|nr:NAD(P)H-dependent oxidoreductase [Desulfosporosinus fructosivorans]